MANDTAVTTKKPWLSKTYWTNVLVPLLAFIPGFSGYVQAHPEMVLMVFGAVNLVLRTITKDKISLED